MYKDLLALLTIGLLFTGNSWGKNPEVKLASLDWEPYIGSTMEGGGYVAQIAIEAFKKVGYDAKIDYLPWARSVKEAEAGAYDGLFPEYMDETRKEKFVYSDSFPGGPLGFYKRKGVDIKFTKLADLEKYKIGTVRGYVNTPEFDNSKTLKKEEATSDEINLKKLQAGRIDLIVIDKFVAQFTISKSFPKFAEEIEFLEPPLEVKPLFIVFSKAAPDYQTKLKDFNAGLKLLNEEGKIKEILKKYGF